MLLAQYGLDKPLSEQYFLYLNKIMHGDFGVSFQYPARSVSEVIRKAFPASLELGLIAFAIAVVVGLFLGIVAALNHNKALDYMAMFTAVLGISIPSFVLGPLLSYYVGNKWGLLPPALWNGPTYKILPSIALSFGTLAIMARLMRTSMIDVLNQDYMKTAKSKGLSQSSIISRHTIRNAILPIVTISGPIFLSTSSRALLSLKGFFSVPGLGTQFVNAIVSNDYTMICGLTIFFIPSF